MNEDNVRGLIGTLNLGLIIANAKDDDFVHITVEDAIEMRLCMEKLKKFLEVANNG